jgi:transketolase
MAVGMAIAERHLNAEFGSELVDHRTWVIAGDGCLMEGVNHEAIGLAGHLKLGRMIVLWDDNHITIDGSTDLSTSEDIRARYAATGWHVVSCNGHDTADIGRAIDEALADPRPSLVACKTLIGKGAPNKQGTSATHGAALGEDEVAAARKTLGWSYPPFEIPADLYADWNATGERGKAARAEWEKRLEGNGRAAEFTARMNGEVPGLHDWADYKAKVAAEGPKMATRKSSEAALGVLTQDVPALIGGSADLTGSNNTKTPSTGPLTAENYGGRYVYYGIREFGMAAAMTAWRCTSG